MKIVVTGAGGFVGRNLCVRLDAIAGHEIVCIGRHSSETELARAISGCRFVFHLAGVNRPSSEDEFAIDNAGFTNRLCWIIEQEGSTATVVFSSSVQAEVDSAYGASKRQAELRLEALAQCGRNRVIVHRLSNVFGKWCRPNYNSVVATFCHNVVHDLPCRVNDPNKVLNLLYIDDLVDNFIAEIAELKNPGYVLAPPLPTHRVTLTELALRIQRFHKDRASQQAPEADHGFERALYATYLSHLPPEAFCYSILTHDDPRGRFAEVIRTHNSGQFSYFTARPGIIRGGHFHNTKNEKFLVVHGTGHFRFRNMADGRTFEVTTTGEKPQIVESIPGWVHDIRNVGEEMLIALLWANESFDRTRPDTFNHSL
ncbi:MAG: NAD-dependent epimerase/dehydratase family protein [Lautropia sp.]